jgi:4-carboxymuconolactone decarboxylase
MSTSEQRFQRGMLQMQKIDGDLGQRVMDALADVSPDLGRYIVEFAFGDLYSRPGLDLKSRELAAVASLVTLGHATPQLKIHINGALNVGWSEQELIEAIMQLAGYAGFPAALNATFTAAEVFAERRAA